MAQSPKYKIYRGDEYVGCVKDATDAAVLVSIQTDGTVRLGHSKNHIVWREGSEGFANESYDFCAERILWHESEFARRDSALARQKNAR